LISVSKKHSEYFLQSRKRLRHNTFYDAPIFVLLTVTPQKLFCDAAKLYGNDFPRAQLAL